MKLKKMLSALAAGVVAMGLALGAATATAEVVLFNDPGDPTKATSIQNLDVAGQLYNVTFDLAFAFEIYDDYPGEFPIFDTSSEAIEARDAVNNALNRAGALSVGNPSGDDGLPIFNIGYDSFEGPLNQLFVNVARGIAEGDEWLDFGLNQWLYNLDEKVYADFTPVGSGGPNQFVLTVNKSGDGSGTVTSSPTGINCGNICSKSYADGTIVVLTAQPGVESEFTSWRGCNQTQGNLCAVIMDAAKTVTVTFSLIGANLPITGPVELLLE